jgi:antitoxin component YwqK of YwqJK toxin-antitoxin module
MALDQTPDDGAWRSYYPGTDQLEKEGEQRGGKGYGVWRFYAKNGALIQESEFVGDEDHGPGRWWSEDGQLTTEGQHEHGKRAGRWRWFHPGGALKEEAGYLDGLLHGEHREWHANGQPKSEGAYRRGYKFGLWRSFDETGRLSEELTLRQNAKHGLCRTIAADGAVTETVFVAGRDDLNDKKAEKKLKSIGGKVKKAKSSYKKLDAARADLIEYSAGVVMIWHLHQTGHIDLAVEPELWTELADSSAAASPAEVFALLSKIQAYDHNKVEAYRFVSFWPESLDRLVAHAYAWEPEAFADWRSLPSPVRDGVALVLRRFGAITREELPPTTVAELATRHVLRYGLNDRPWRPVEGARGVLDGKIEPGYQWPGPAFAAYIEQFCDMDTWAKASLAAAKEAEYRLNITSAAHGLTIASLKELGALFKAIDATKGQLYHLLLTLRADDPIELFQISKELQADRPYVADPVRYAAILRCKALGVPVPKGVEAGTTLQGYEGITGGSDKNLQGLEQVVEALHHLGEQRAVALLRGVLANPYYKDHALPFLGEFDDAALWEDARAAIGSFTEKNFPGMELTAYGLGRLPATKLPWLIETYDGAPAVQDLREGLTRAILHVLAGIGARGEWIEDEAVDRFIKFDGWEAKGLGDYYYGHYVNGLLLRALKAIPNDRAIMLVRAQLGVNRLRPFGALAILNDAATTTLAFDVLAASAETLDSAMARWVKEGVTALGATAHAEIRRVLGVQPHPSLVKVFKDALGDVTFKSLTADLGAKEETPVARLKRLANKLPGGKTRIYALRRRRDDDEEQAEGEVETGLSQTGGAPPPLSDARWPTFKKEKMEFLLALDLDQLPELRQGRPEAAAVALYLSSIDENAAYTPYNKESAVVWLTREEAEAWAPLRAADSGAGILVEALDVPSAALYASEDDGALHELHRLIYALPGRALGAPIWLQGDEDSGGEFLFQFDEALAYTNLGDSGVMYVFDDTAFWQCH